MSFARKVGSWDRARRAVGPRTVARFKAAQSIALRAEGQDVRDQLIKDIKAGNVGGKRLARLAPSTLKTRRFRGIQGSRPLIATERLIRAIKVVSSGSASFIGIPFGARDDRGKQLANIAAVQEHGATIVMPLTPQVIAMFRAIGLTKQGRKTGGVGGGSKFVIIRIKPRPIFKPAMDKYMRDKKKAARRVALTISKSLGGIFGAPT